MKRNSVLPLAAVLAIGAAWTIFTQADKNPLTVNMNPLRKSTTQTTVSVRAPSITDRIEALFPEDTDRFTLRSVECQDAVCTVELLGDPEVLRTHIQDLVRENPWLGSWDLQKKEGPTGAFLAIFHLQTR